MLKENKLIVFGCIVAALFFFFLGKSYSGEYHHSIAPSSGISYNYKGIASGISAAQCHPNLGQVRLQGCFSASNLGTAQAFTFGLAQKYKQTLINGTITKEDNTIGLGIGLNWNF